MDVDAKVNEARAKHDRAVEIMAEPEIDQYGVYRSHCYALCALAEFLDVLQFLARERQPWQSYPNPE